MKIAFVTPELQSLVRRTNLAGVAESLIRALKEAGADVRVVMPWTRDLEDGHLKGLERICAFPVLEGLGGQIEFEVYSAKLDDIPVYLLAQEELFAGRRPYGDDQGPYPDNWRRYTAFARAVLESLGHLNFQADVIHSMDWTAGMIPVIQRLEYLDEQPDHPAAHGGTYFGIHNFAMQGSFEREILPHMGIPHDYFRAVEGIESGGKVNFLKAGAEFATIIGTHSPTHASKIQERDRGYGLEETFVRRKKELVGITNGIDYHAWNPENDPLLPAPFSAKDTELAGKKKCKAALQAALGLDNGPRTPVACTIGRWDADSGFDILAEVLTQILERNVELVLMGQGQPDIQQRLMTIETTFIGRCKVVANYDQSTAHLLMGGADLLLLPSHYQPSNPLFAIGMRYGTVPLVYAHGGLEDVVTDAAQDTRTGTGFHFEPYNSDSLMDTVNEAIKVYKEPAGWKKIVRRCLAQDFSWSATAAEYLKAYRRVTRRARARRAGV